jgi:hypothetical protein
MVIIIVVAIGTGCGSYLFLFKTAPNTLASRFSKRALALADPWGEV